MTKIQVNILMEENDAAELRNRAAKHGVPIGDLSSLYHRFAHTRMTDEAIARWAANRPDTRGRLGGALTKHERAVSEALTELLARGAPEGVRRVEVGEVAAQAGLVRKEAYLALKRLQQRKLAVGVDGADLDQWQRPRESFWSMPG